jgi:hypothetical protein
MPPPAPPPHAPAAPAAPAADADTSLFAALKAHIAASRGAEEHTVIPRSAFYNADGTPMCDWRDTLRCPTWRDLKGLSDEEAALYKMLEARARRGAARVLCCVLCFVRSFLFASFVAAR